MSSATNLHHRAFEFLARSEERAKKSGGRGGVVKSLETFVGAEG